MACWHSKTGAFFCLLWLSSLMLTKDRMQSILAFNGVFWTLLVHQTCQSGSGVGVTWQLHLSICLVFSSLNLVLFFKILFVQWLGPIQTLCFNSFVLWLIELVFFQCHNGCLSQKCFTLKENFTANCHHYFSFLECKLLQVSHFSSVSPDFKWLYFFCYDITT